MLVALAVAAAVVIGAWLFYSSGSRQITTAQRKLDALRTAHLLFELLHRDLVSAKTVMVLPPPPHPPPPAPPPKGPPPCVFFIDGKEYSFDPTTRRVTVAGEVFRLGLFDELSAEVLPGGRVRIRLASVADPPEVPDGFPGKRAGRTVIEMDTTVVVLRDSVQFPGVVDEDREWHGYCSLGDAIDY